MRLKGINPIEQHVEKLVLVIFSVALLGLLVMQFLGNPNAVEVGGRTVPAENARSLVGEKAQQKKGQLESIRVADELQRELVDYVGPFSERLQGGAGEPVRMAALGTPTITRTDSSGGSSTNDGTFVADVKPLHVVAPPKPSAPVVAPFEGAVNPIVAAPIASRIPQLGEQPYDLRGVTVQTSFDASSFKSSLNNPPDDRTQLPTDWLRTIQILDVQLWRQRHVDGEWTDATLVESMPGRANLRETLARSDFRPAELPDLLRLERESRTDIRTPAMYEMIAGLPWVEPVKFASQRRAVPDRQLVESILRSLESIDMQLQQQTTRRAEISDPDGRNANAAQRLDREIAKIQASREEILMQLSNLGVDESGNLILDAGDDSELMMMEGDKAAPAAQGIMDSIAPVNIWAHDVMLEPGATYRYQIRLEFTNPLFGRQSRLQPAQKPLGMDLTTSVETDWSDAIEVPEPVLFYALDANPARSANGINQPASIQVIAARFFYGYWRTAEARVQSGSVIHASASLPELWTWAQGSTGAGDRSTLADALPIDTGRLLIGVAARVSAAIPRLDSGITVHNPDGSPSTRTPGEDRASQRLAEIRFSAQKGESTAIPETLVEDNGV